MARVGEKSTGRAVVFWLGPEAGAMPPKLDTCHRSAQLSSKLASLPDSIWCQGGSQPHRVCVSPWLVPMERSPRLWLVYGPGCQLTTTASRALIGQVTNHLLNPSQATDSKSGGNNVLKGPTTACPKRTMGLGEATITNACWKAPHILKAASSETSTLTFYYFPPNFALLLFLHRYLYWFPGLYTYSQIYRHQWYTRTHTAHSSAYCCSHLPKHHVPPRGSPRSVGAIRCWPPITGICSPGLTKTVKPGASQPWKKPWYSHLKT